MSVATTGGVKKLSPVETLLVYGFLLLVVVGYYLFWASPKLRELSSLRSEISSAEVQLRIRENEERALAVAEERVGMMRQFRDEFLSSYSLLPKKEDIASAVLSLASESGVRVHELRFGPSSPWALHDDPRAVDNLYMQKLMRTPLSLSLDGEWLSQQRFLYGIYRIYPHLQPTLLEVTVADGTYAMKLELDLVYLGGERQ